MEKKDDFSDFVGGKSKIREVDFSLIHKEN